MLTGLNWIISLRLSGINKRLNELEISFLGINKKLGSVQKLKAKVDCIYSFNLNNKRKYKRK